MPPSWPCSTLDPGSASSDESPRLKPARVAGGVATGEGIGRGVGVADGVFLLSLQATSATHDTSAAMPIAMRNEAWSFLAQMTVEPHHDTWLRGVAQQLDGAKATR